MPRVPPPNGVKFKGGQTGNKQGSSKKVRARKAIAELAAMETGWVTPQEFARGFLATIAGGEEIDKLANDPKANCYRAFMAKTWVIGCQTGDLNVLKEFADRIVGKPRTQVSLSGPDGDDLNITFSRNQMTTEEKLARVEALAQARLLAQGD